MPVDVSTGTITYRALFGKEYTPSTRGSIALKLWNYAKVLSVLQENLNHTFIITHTYMYTHMHVHANTRTFSFPYCLLTLPT